MTREEFFMYLTIGLIILVPLATRLYRRATLKKTTQMLREQFEAGSKQGPSNHTAAPKDRPTA
jgi:hypothetical protein